MSGGYVEYGIYKITTRKTGSGVLSGAAARTGKLEEKRVKEICIKE